MSATTAFPTVIAAIVDTVAASLTGARVVRGRDISNDPGDVVMVGIQSLDDTPGWDSAGSFDQEFQTFGGARTETGTVNGIALSWDGDSDQEAATVSAFALIAGLAAALKATPALGIATFDYIVTQPQTGDVHEAQSDDGATTWLAFVVEYQARIT